jgi:hypothetical protein
MGNWEQLHTFAAVCKLWRHGCLPHLSNIGKVPMDGGAERRLNIGAFLHYLQLKHFRNVQCIFILCIKTKGLLVNDIKQVYPSVQTIVHSKWLIVNGRMEEIQEGEGHHQCYRVYWHDMRVRMYGYNLPGTKCANLFWNRCLLCRLFYNNTCRLKQHF